MNADRAVTAAVLIDNLRKAIDEVWAKYGNTPLDSLIYARAEYGVMQYAELRENLDLLWELKRRLDWLSEESLELTESQDSELRSWPDLFSPAWQTG